MVDFVLERNSQGLRKHNIKQVRGYAKFLKQPLELGMFVPCDEDGNMLKEPENFESEYQKIILDEQKSASKSEQEKWKKLKQYQKAKERVLFEGCYIHHFDLCGMAITAERSDIIYTFDDEKFSYYNIEQLERGCDLELTPTALKQIGL